MSLLEADGGSKQTMMGSRFRIWVTMFLLSFPFISIGASTCAAAASKCLRKGLCDVYKRINGTERSGRFTRCRFLFGSHDHQDLRLRPRCPAPVVRDRIWLDVAHEDGVFWETFDEICRLKF